MDAKITKKRLAGMLSYDWLKIVALIVAFIIVWMLVFTMTATRITPAQQFTVFNYSSNGALSNDFFKFYNKTRTNGVFSYEVIETNYTDLTTGSEYASTVLEARVSVEEGDVMFVPAIDDTSTAYEVEVDNPSGEGKIKQTKYGRTYLESFVSGYFPMLYNLDPNAQNGYFKQMEAFLDTYYTQGYRNESSLDEERVKADFVARITKNGDKRFKTQEEIEQGKADEVERIQKYRAALIKFLDEYLNVYVTITHVDLKNMDGSLYKNAAGEDMEGGAYAINLCPDEDKMKNLHKQVFYYVASDTDKETYKKVAKDMQVCLFNFKSVRDGFQYESLLYINALIEECRTKTA